jgi:hypothetical protein
MVMSRVKKPLPEPLADEAASVRARRELDELDMMRFVQKSMDAGVTQAAVAAALGTSAATISRLVKSLATDPGITRPTVDEVVSRTLVHDISRKEMVTQLLSIQMSPVRPDRRPDSDWAQFARAVRAGRIRKSEASLITADVAARLVRRVNHSMNLEGQPVPPESTARLVEQTSERLMATL